VAFVLCVCSFLFVATALDIYSPSRNVISKRGACPPNEITNGFKGAVLANRGGLVLVNPMQVYIIYYGTSFTNITSLRSQLAYFINNLGATPWFGFTTALTNSAGVHISSALSFGGDVVQTNLNRGPNITIDIFKAIIADNLAANVFPASSNNVYIVINGEGTVLDTTAIGRDFCGTHNVMKFNNQNIYVSLVVGNVKHLRTCYYAKNGPNSELVNHVATTLAHEVIEVLSDPTVNLTGWVSPGGQENGDLCANIHIPALDLPSTNGKLYNVQVGTQQYYLQPNYDPITACCGYPGSSPAPPPPPPGPPAASSSPPSGSSAPPAGSSAPPAGSSSAPAGSSAPPAGSSAAPRGSINSSSCHLQCISTFLACKNNNTINRRQCRTAKVMCAHACPIH